MSSKFKIGDYVRWNDHAEWSKCIGVIVSLDTHMCAWIKLCSVTHYLTKISNFQVGDQLMTFQSDIDLIIFNCPEYLKQL